MSITFKEANKHLEKKGFYLINHPVVRFHMLKDFADYDITQNQFYILPVGKDYLHVAVIEYETMKGEIAVEVRYTFSGDDLLYGLRSKYRCGGSFDPRQDLTDIDAFVLSGNIRNNERYIRKRFRHGRTKAKVRALFVMIVEMWRSLWTFK